MVKFNDRGARGGRGRGARGGPARGRGGAVVPIPPSTPPTNRGRGRGGADAGRGRGSGKTGTVNVLGLSSPPSKTPNMKVCTICSRGTRQVGKDTCLECTMQLQKQKKQGAKSWPTIPPPPKPPKSLSAVHSFTIQDDDDDDAQVIEDDVDLTADDEATEKNGNESDEDGPDYEPVNKRTKKTLERVPTPPKVLVTPKGKENPKGKATATAAAKGKAAATAKVKETAKAKETPKQKETPKPKATKKTESKKKEKSPEPELLEIDDEDDEIIGVTYVKGKGKAKSTNDGIIVLDDEDDDDDDAALAGAVRFTVKGSSASNGDEVVPNEADEDVVSAAIDILVDNPDDDASMPTPAPRRPPITATIEEIVPEKYRTLYLSYPSDDPFVNEDTLWTLFAQFGEIEDLVVDEPTKSRFCEGHVVFLKFYAVDACVKAKPLKIDTCSIEIRRTEEKPDEKRHKEKIHVSGIYHLTNEDLERYFNTFGTVKEVTVLSNRGFAFVEFDDGDSADKTILQKYHPIDGLVLEVQRCFIKKPEDRRRPRDPRDPKPKPKFDHGPISRGDGANICVTPFPRHVEIKPKKDDAEPIPFDRPTTTDSDNVKPFKSEVKDEK